MRKILFDFVPFEDKFVNGGALYVRTVLFNLLQQDVCLYGICSSIDKLSDEIKNVIRERQIPVIILEKNFVQKINTEKFDCFFVGIAQRYSLCDLSGINCRIVIVCHDIGDICRYKAKIDRNYDMVYDTYKAKNKKLPKLRCYRNFWKRIIFEKSILGFSMSNRKMLKQFGYENFYKLLRQSNVFPVTVSQYSAYAMRYYFENICNEIKVFYPPKVDRLDLGISDEIRKICADKRYFLFISADRLNKNYWVFEKAFKKFNADRNKEFEAIVIGLPSRTDDCFHYIEKVNERELEYLMQKAYSLVYASTSEGFGYPPIEAMNFGTPVIAAYDTSIPEVCGKNILYFNPIYQEDLYYKMFLLVENYEYYEGLSKIIADQVVEKQKDDLKNLISYIL